jgi:hypothetical protein
MKTAIQLAIVRIEMLYGMKPDNIHWKLFKNDCMEKEQIVNAHWERLKNFSTKYYNQNK